MRVLVVTCRFPPFHCGGYGLHMSWFCDGLRARGHSIHVLTSRGPAGQADPDDSKAQVDRSLDSLDSTSGGLLLMKSWRNISAVRRAIDRTNPDIVFCGAMDGVGFNTYLAAIGAGRPSFTWLGDTWLGQAWRDLARYDAWHNLASGGRGQGVGRAARRAIGLFGECLGLSRDDRPRRWAPVAALSQFIVDDLRNSGAPVPVETKIIPVSLHKAFFDASGEPIGHSGCREKPLRALFVGRMELLKGPDIAIQAVAAANAAGTDVRLTLAGFNLDRLRPQLEQLATNLKVLDRITWGGTPDLTALVQVYRNHDVFLFPSRIVEGLGVVNCEAAACGLPVIGTAHSGSAEVILPDINGYRIAKDDASAMARHLVELYFDRALLDRLSNGAIRVARRFAPALALDLLEGELQLNCRSSASRSAA